MSQADIDYLVMVIASALPGSTTEPMTIPQFRDKLDAYRRSNPTDPRAEDAAYLTILALQRAGRRDDAAAAARRYLQHYPNGYRRAEVQKIAR